MAFHDGIEMQVTICNVAMAKNSASELADSLLSNFDDLIEVFGLK